MVRTSVATLLIVAVLSFGCNKEEDDSPNDDYPGHGYGLVPWCPQLLIVEGADTTELIAGPWQLSTESVFTPSGVPDHWYAMHEVVMWNAAMPAEQWRLGFIGLLQTTTGTGPTNEQCANMVVEGTFTGGRWDWDAVNMVYNIQEGVRIRYIDPASTTYTSDTSATGEVLEVVTTEFEPTRHARLVVEGMLSSAMGQRECIYAGPVLWN